MSRPKYRITHSLLSAHAWSFTDDGYEGFLQALRREPSELTLAMMNGREFERLVSETNVGNPPPENHKWYDGVMETASIVQGSAEQVWASRDIEIDGVDFQIVGVLDNLRAGVILDTKFTKSYRPGKYHNSTQHPMYFALVPEARRFVYIVCDGQSVWRESYEPYDTRDIRHDIHKLMEFLHRRELMETYKENWRVKE